MTERSQDVSKKLKEFLDEVASIDVRAEYLASLNLKWDQPEGKPVNLGYITQYGAVWTEASYWQVDHDLAQDYNERLAELFGGKVKTTGKRSWVAQRDGTPFRIEDVADRLSGWRQVIETFQSAIRARAQNIGT